MVVSAGQRGGAVFGTSSLMMFTESHAIFALEEKKIKIVFKFFPKSILAETG